MLWRGRRESSNVEDRRGIGGGGLIAGGGIGAVVIGIIYLLLGGDPSQVANQLQQNPQRTEQRSAREEELAGFSKVVLAETEDVWREIFRENNSSYTDPTLVLFTGQTQSACGFSSAATGPFYCPGDRKIYIDLSFFDEMETRFGAAGDFAMAYVIAHEVGHHIQNLMGTLGDVHERQQALNRTESNKLSVQTELQADFYAGVWANRTQKVKQILQEGDIEEAIGAANAIGDDRLQQQSQGYVVPDAFTHGSSQQRMYWFKKGFQSGDIRQGNTFTQER